MDKYRKINNFDIQLLREFPGLTVYNDQLFLNDSIDDRWPKKVKMFPSLPAKMRFTTIFLCVDGEARTRVPAGLCHKGQRHLHGQHRQHRREHQHHR